MELAGGRCDLRPSRREEEAFKRNTDCIYFLASPFTCKKGSECEYRHSEGARVNPRDCKFWFSGNCLNPKCLFRHPPLDGLVGNPMAASGPIMTASQFTTSMRLPLGNSSAYNFNRNNVPCHYFQKGTCLKGDKCPFMHGPQPTGNSVAKHSVKVSAPVTTQLETTKTDARKLKEFSNKQNLSIKENAGKPVNGASSLLEGSLALENGNVHLVHKTSRTRFSEPPSLHVQSVRHRLNEHEAGQILEEFSGVGYTNLKRTLNQQLQSSRYRNEKGVEEVFREFSPGFNVLVNNVVKVADYLHDKDGFGSKPIQGGRNMNHYGKVQNGVDGYQHRTFPVSERIFDKAILPIRRSRQSLRNPNGVYETDLRHRLMKQRRLNNSLSATFSNPESKAYSRHELKMQNRVRGNRLSGRIPLSKPLSQKFPSELLVRGRGRQRGNLLPLRQSSLQRRLGERLSRRVIQNYSGNARNIGNQLKSRDNMKPLDFAGPRSLAELKCSKADESSKGQLTKNIHFFSSMEHYVLRPQVTVAFDCPKPLSTLRKRNREASPENDVEVSSCTFEAAPVSELLAKDSLEACLEGTKVFISSPKEPEVGTVVEEEEVVHIPADVEQVTYEQQAAEDETETRDTAEDEEPYYTDDQIDGEYDYETVGDGDYKTEDDENMDPMNIDEDDFAKMVGLIETQV